MSSFLNPLDGLAAGGQNIVNVGLSLAYVIASVILMFKTPSLVKGFLSGTGWVVGIMGTALKGVAGSAAIGLAAVTAGIGAVAGAGAVGAGGAAGTAGASGAAGAGGKALVGARMAKFFGAPGSARNVLLRSGKAALDQAGHIAKEGGDPVKGWNSKRAADERAAYAKSRNVAPPSDKPAGEPPPLDPPVL